MTLTPQLIVTLLGCAVATVTDLRTGKIYNDITMSMMAVGVAMNALFGDPLAGVLGLLLATAIHYTLWRLGVQRGGDAKLLMGIGALMGWEFVLAASAWYAILYLPIGFFVLIVRGRLKNFGATVSYELQKRAGVEPDEADKPEPTILKTGPIIAAATVAAALT